jgi:putative tricarboxylic transport membrane protein
MNEGPAQATPALKLPDLVFGLVVLALAGFVWREAAGLPPSPYDPLGPGSFPRALCIGLGLLSVAMIVRTLMRLTVADAETSFIMGPADGTPGPRRFWLALGLGLATAAYAGLLILADLDFRLVTIVYIAGLGFALSRRRRQDIFTAIAVGVVMGFGLDWLFTGVLAVTLP